MTEKELVTIGFKKIKIPEEDCLGDAFYYYIYKVGLMDFITNANIEIDNPKEWYVEVLECEAEFRKLDELKIVIGLLEQNKKI
tara:strand:+ start:25 stop:273 length:249 start_codon:yes stop_codon:yes gene_type:complete